MRPYRMVLMAALLVLAAVATPGCAVGLRKSAFVGLRLAQRSDTSKIVPAAAEEPTPPDANIRPATDAKADSQTGPASGNAGDGSRATSVSLSSAVRGWYHTAAVKWHAFKAWYLASLHKNLRWPQPHQMFARRAFYDAWDIQAAAGKRFRFGLFDYHFVAGTGELNAMGQRRLAQILRNLGPHDRVVYLQAAMSKAETEERMATVRAAIERYAVAPAEMAVVVIPDAPASMTGAEARKTIDQLIESVGRFPRWMDRNVRMQRSNSGANSGSSSRSSY